MSSAFPGSFSARSLFLAAAAALALGAPVAAASDETAMDPAALRQFVNAVTVQIDGQLPRYHRPLCPAVTGLKSEPAAAVLERLHAAAGRAGLESAPQGCDPNLIVMIVDDARATVRALRKEGSLAMLDEAERRRVLASDGPAIAFSDTELQNDDGQQVVASTNVMFSGSGSRAKSVSYLPVRSVSLLNAPTQQATIRTIVILESGALAGRTLAQVGDLAAMWGIGGVRRDAKAMPGTPSILSLVGSGDEAPAGLTPFDIAFLEAVYGTEPNARAVIQRQKIAERISAAMTAR